MPGPLTHRIRSALARPAHLAAEQALRLSGRAPPQVLLVLGHMRSGSTLLLHLLMTDPRVSAVGERNRPYRGEADLARLALESRRVRTPGQGDLRLVVDQLNHNHLTPRAQLLGARRVRLLFLLRRPEGSLTSLLRLSREFYGDAWTPERAVDYYVTRLDFLADLYRGLAGRARAAFLRYETLTAQPAAVLGRLCGLVDFEAHFQTRYAAQPFTGSRGDPGSRIRAGEVLPEAAPAVAPELSAAALERARGAYERCRDVLSAAALVPADARA